MAIRFDTRTRSALLWLGLPVLAGAIVRAFGLSTQVLGGDAVHGVIAALGKPASVLLRTYDPADYCLPLAAFARWLMDRGFTLSELGLRLPVAIAGVLLVAWVPWVLLRRISLWSAVLLAWLLALSPMLVLYSRIARSYMPMTLLSIVAVVCFERWWRERSARHAAGYVLAATGAVYFHLGAGPFVIAPFLFAAGSQLARRRALTGDWRRLGVLLLATGAGMALFVIPAWDSLSTVVAGKRDGSFPGVAGLVGAARLHAGTSGGVLTLLFYAAAARGLFELWRRDSRLAAFTGTLVLGQLIGFALLTPTRLEDPLVFARYAIMCLPVILLWVAVGLTVPFSKTMPRLSWLQAPAAVALAAALFATGPLGDRAYWSSSLTTHRDFLGFGEKRRELPTGLVPSFYLQLADLAPGALIEFPWNMSWKYSHSLFAYQQVHGRRTILSTPFSPLYDPRLALRSVVPPTPGDFLASSARYLIVHLDLASEELRLRELDPKLGPPFPLDLPQWRELRSSGRALAEHLEEVWGTPVYSDTRIRAWDLESQRGVGRGA